MPPCEVMVGPDGRWPGPILRARAECREAERQPDGLSLTHRRGVRSPGGAGPWRSTVLRRLAKGVQAIRAQTLFLVGVVLGAVMGLAMLLAGPAILFPGLIIWTWLIAKRPRFVGASAGFIGFGVAWLLLVGQAILRCANDPTCTQADQTAWFVFGGAFVAIGVALGLFSWWRLRGKADRAGVGRSTAA